MKTFLLVFDDGSDPEINLSDFVELLDDGAQMYALDGHVCFIQTSLDASELSARFMNIAGSNLFFVTEVSASDYAGRMVGPFWDFFKSKDAIASAA